MEAAQLSNLQLELLKLYSTDMREEELAELKTLMANFFAKQAIGEADQIWRSKQLSDDDMESWLSET